MKLILFLLVLVAMVYGCREAKPEELQEFIPGTYIRYSKHEFGEEYDTITVNRYNLEFGYTITRRWKYERLGMQPKYELTNSAGSWDEEANILEDMETGDLLSFDRKKYCLFIGITKYDKL